MNASAAAVEPDLLDQLPGLIEHLRTYDYQLSLEDELRLVTLADEIHLRGDSVPDRDALERVIAPLVCRNPDDQERLPQILNRWYIAQPGANQSGDGRTETAAASRAVRSRRRRRRLRVALAAAIVLAFAGLLGWLAWPTAQGNIPVGPVVQNQTGGSGGGVPVEDGGDWDALARYLLALLPLAAAGIFYLRRRRTSAIARGEAPCDAAARALKIGAIDSPWFRPGAVQGALRDLRRHRRVPSSDLDIPRTVAATARAAGFVQFVFGRRFILPDYLLLGDRASGQDHFGELGEVLAARLRVEQLRVARGEYFGDPTRLVLIGADGRRRHTELDRVAGEQPGTRLLMIADVASFWDPVRGQWRDWVMRLKAFETVAVLTPIPRAQWGERERALIRKKFLIVPATNEGITDLARQFRFEEDGGRVGPGSDAAERLDRMIAAEPYLWSGNAPPPAERVRELIRALAAALDRGALLHLCTIAVFPTINPRLTEQVGALLKLDDGGPAMTDGGYAAMARLPWLRRGRIPDWLRKALIEAMSPTDADRARALWVSLLAREPHATEQGVALEIVGERPDRAALRHLLRALRAGAEPDLTERIMLAFLAGRRLPDLSVAAPGRLAGPRLPVPNWVDGLVVAAAAAATAAWLLWGNVAVIALRHAVQFIVQLVGAYALPVLGPVIAMLPVFVGITAFSSTLRFGLFEAWVRYPLIGTIARLSRMEGPTTGEANARLDLLFRAYHTHILQPLPEAEFARIRQYLRLAGDAGARPTPLIFSLLLIILMIAQALPFAILLGVSISPDLTPSTVDTIAIALAVLMAALFATLGQAAGKAFRRTRALRAAWREALDPDTSLQSGEKPWLLLTGLIDLEDDQDRDRPVKGRFDGQRFLNRVRRMPDDLGSYVLPVMFGTAVVAVGVLQLQLGLPTDFIAELLSLRGGFPALGETIPLWANGLFVLLFFLTQGFAFYLGSRYVFLGKQSARAYRLLGRHDSYADLIREFETRVRRADASLTRLRGKFLRKYPSIAPDPALYLDRFQSLPVISADLPEIPLKAPEAASPVRVSEAQPVEAAPRWSARISPVIKAIAALVALVPAFALLMGLVDVPARARPLLGIFSVVGGLAVVLGLFLLRDRIAKMAPGRVTIQSAFAVLLGAAAAVAYYRFGSSHMVSLVGESYVVPLSPSAELARYVAPFGGDYGMTLALSPDRARVAALMNNESGSSLAVMVALLMLAQISIAGGILVSVLRLLGDPALEQDAEAGGNLGRLIKGLGALFALVPGLAFMLGLGEVPGQIQDLVKILSFSVSLMVLLGVFLLADRIRNMAAARVVISSVVALALGVAMTIGYFQYAGDHTVQVAGDSSVQTYVTPLAPSAELTRYLDRFGGDYRVALEVSPNRDQVRSLINAESTSSVVVMIVLLLLAQTLLIGSVVAAAWRLAGGPAPEPHSEATMSKSRKPPGLPALTNAFRALGLGGAVAAIPLFAHMQNLQPPWASATGYISAAVIVLAALTASILGRSASRRTLRALTLVASSLSVIGLFAYLYLYAQLVVTFASGDRVILGFSCNADAQLLYATLCPNLTEAELAQAGYDPVLLFTPGSLSAARLSLLAAWLLFNAGLAAASARVAIRGSRSEEYSESPWTLPTI